MDMGVVGVEGAGGRDGVLEGRCCVFEGVLDLQNESWSSWSSYNHLLALPYSLPPTLVSEVPVHH